MATAERTVLIESAPGEYVEQTLPITYEKDFDAVSGRVPHFWVGKTQYCHSWDAPDGRWVFRAD